MTRPIDLKKELSELVDGLAELDPANAKDFRREGNYVNALDISSDLSDSIEQRRDEMAQKIAASETIRSVMNGIKDKGAAPARTSKTAIAEACEALDTFEKFNALVGKFARLCELQDRRISDALDKPERNRPTHSHTQAYLRSSIGSRDRDSRNGGGRPSGR